MTKPTPPTARRVRTLGAALLAACCAWGPGAGQAAAQVPTVHLQGAALDNVAATATLGLQLGVPLGDPGLPGRGGVVEGDVRSWLLTLGAGGGVSFARARGSDDGFTAVGHLGLMVRTGSLVEQVGIVAYGNTEPLGAGPALRAKIAVLDVLAGGMWMDEGLGFRWFAGGGISLEFLRDVFAR